MSARCVTFIQAAGKNGAAACTVTWDGVRKQPISAGRYVAQIARLRRHGGDVIPSFGGFSADQGAPRSLTRAIWALQRDHGGCPGVIDSNSCSGIEQKSWAFSHLLEPFGQSSDDAEVSPAG